MEVAAGFVPFVAVALHLSVVAEVGSLVVVLPSLEVEVESAVERPWYDMKR